MSFFSAALSNAQLTKLRGDSSTPPRWSADQYVSLNPNTTIFAARVNGAVSTTTGFASVEFDTVTVGAFGDVRVDQRVLFSATNDIRAAYLDTRVRAALDSNTLPIAETSVDIADNDYIFVIDDYPLTDRLARPTSATVQAKDYATTFLRLAPVVKGVQPVYVDYISSGTSKLRIVLDASNSYVTDNDAASISSYAWVFTGVTATVISGSLSGSAVTVDVTEGHGWGHLTLTDSAGVVWVYHFEIHAHGDTYTPVFGFEGAQITGDLENGYTCSFNAFTGVSSVYDNTRITVWRSYEYYNGTEGELISGINVDFVGWIRNETGNNRSDPQYSYVSDIQFEVIGVAQRLAELEGQALALRDNAAPDEWDEIESLQPWRGVVYVWQRHTTLLNLFPLDFDSIIKSTTYRFPMIPAIGGNPLAIAKGILDQVNGSLEFSGDGRINICRIGHYLTSGQRSSLTNVIDLDTQDYIEFNEQRSQFKRVGRVLADGAFWDGVVQMAAPLRSVAPGHAQAPGAEQAQLNNQVLASTAVQSDAQAELNLRAAIALAIFNDEGNQVDLLLPDGYHAAFIPSYGNTYTLTITTSDNIRGIAYTTADKWFCTAVNHTHSHGDEQGAGMGSREVRVTLKKLLAIPTAGETIEQIADGDIMPAIPDLPPFPAFDFELPETMFPLAGLTAIDPKLLEPPKNKVAKVDGGTLIMKSTDGTKAFLVQNAIAKTYPDMRDITPPDLGDYTIRAVLFDPLNKADSAGNKYAYILASDGTDSKVWRTSNVFALPKPTWTASSALTGVYTILRGNNAAGAIAIYAPATTGSTTVVSVPAITASPGNNTGIAVTSGDTITITAVGTWSNDGVSSWGASGEAVAADPSFVLPGANNYSLIGRIGTSGSFFAVGASYSGTAGATGNLYLMMNDNAFGDNTGSLSATVSVTTGTSALARFSSDFGATFGSAVTVGTSPGGIGGFDAQKAGAVTFAAADNQIRVATTLGGAYANAGGGGFSNDPNCIIQPYYRRGSVSTTNTNAADPDYIVGLSGGTNTLYWVDGLTDTQNNITPVSSAPIPTPNAVTTSYGTHIAAIVNDGGTYKLYTSTNNGGAWSLRQSLTSNAKFVRSRRGDTRAKAGGNKGQLWVANGSTLIYSYDWGATRGTRTLSVSCDQFDVLG